MTTDNEPSSDHTLSDHTLASKDSHSGDEVPAAKVCRDLPPAAQRALAEAQARREAGAIESIGGANLPREINGRGGKDPARYADWEVKGIAVDF
ncbi:MAG: DUF1674 domain-containing protein [Pseudomonadota bacterium]